MRRHIQHVSLRNRKPVPQPQALQSLSRHTSPDEKYEEYSRMPKWRAGQQSLLQSKSALARTVFALLHSPLFLLELRHSHIVDTSVKKLQLLRRIDKIVRFRLAGVLEPAVHVLVLSVIEAIGSHPHVWVKRAVANSFRPSVGQRILCGVNL